MNTSLITPSPRPQRLPAAVRCALSVTMALYASFGWAKPPSAPARDAHAEVAKGSEIRNGDIADKLSAPVAPLNLQQRSPEPGSAPLQQAAESADKALAASGHHGRSGFLWALPIASAAGAGLAWLLVRIGLSQRSEVREAPAPRDGKLC